MNRNNLNELLFVIYLFSFVFNRIILNVNEKYTFAFLLIISIIVLLISFIFNDNNVLKSNLLFIILFVLLYFIISLLINYNSFALTYMYEFIIYGIIPMFLYSRIKNIKKIIEFGGIFSIISFLIFFADPINKYYYFSDYMNFGLICMLPIFIFSILSRKLLNKKKFIILEIFAFLELLLFSNRGALLTAIISEIVLYFIDDKKSIINRKVIKITITVFISVVLFVNLNTIFESINKLISKYNFNSYSITAITYMINGTNDGLSGRDDIWNNALNFIQKSPLLGSGIGSFEKQYGIYTHNIILETLTSSGIIGLIIIMITIIKYIKNIKKTEEKSFYYTILIIGLVPLIFSIYIFKWIYFWIFVYIAYDTLQINKKHISEGGKDK